MFWFCPKYKNKQHKQSIKKTGRVWLYIEVKTQDYDDNIEL